jgi:hypothetical protein
VTCDGVLEIETKRVKFQCKERVFLGFWAKRITCGARESVSIQFDDLN